MSTTVSYKNNNIAIVSNATKILNTAGTWLEADIVLTDTSGVDGDLLGYGDSTEPMVGVAVVDNTII